MHFICGSGEPAGQCLCLIHSQPGAQCYSHLINRALITHIHSVTLKREMHTTPCCSAHRAKSIVFSVELQLERKTIFALNDFKGSYHASFISYASSSNDRLHYFTGSQRNVLRLDWSDQGIIFVSAELYVLHPVRISTRFGQLSCLEMIVYPTCSSHHCSMWGNHRLWFTDSKPQIYVRANVQYLYL